MIRLTATRQQPRRCTSGSATAVGQARIHHNLGVLAERQGRYADALGHAEQALRLYQAIGDKAGEAEALNNVGWCQPSSAKYPQALAFLSASARP